MARPGITYCCLLWLALAFVSVAQEEKETLDNQAIVKMVQAHLGADLIVAQIQSSPGKYSLTSASLIRLKQQGVPDKVIAAMQGKANESRPSETKKDTEKPKETSEPPAAQTVQSPYAWDVDDVLDRITNEHHVEGFLSQRPSRGSAEELQVKATCDGSGMHWLIVYGSGTTPAAGYKLNYPNGGGGGGGLVLGGIGGIAAGLMGAVANARIPNGPWVVLQVKMDRGQPATVISTADYKNYAQVNFEPEVLPSSGDPEMDHANRVLAPIQNRAVAKMTTLANAQTVLVALPREDDSTMYLEVRPREPSFQKLLNECGVEASKLPVASGGDTNSGAVHGGMGNRESSASASSPAVNGETFTDGSTGLMWTRSDSGHGMPWAEAQQYCGKLRTGGYSDWRLPDSNELKTLYDPSARRRAVCSGWEDDDGGNPLRVRAEINLSCYWMWSSTKGRDIAQPDWAGGPIHMMGMFNFYNGTAVDSYPDKKDNAALCVRKGTR